MIYNKGQKQSLYDVEVYCSHKSKGCEWRGELKELDKYLISEPPADKSLEACMSIHSDQLTVPWAECAGCERRVCHKDNCKDS